jgi:hypothetical protein
MNEQADLSAAWFSEFLANPTEHTSVVLPGPKDTFVLIEARSDTNGSVHIHARLIALPMSIAEIQAAISTLKPNMYRERRLVEQYVEAAQAPTPQQEPIPAVTNHREEPERVYTQPAHDERYAVKAKKRSYTRVDTPCPICQRVFNSIPAMRTHMWKKHPIEFAETLEAKRAAEAAAEPTTSAKSDNVYQSLTMEEARARWLTTHPDTIYPEPETVAKEDNYFCKVCGKVYAKENWLFRHLVKSHPEVDPYAVADLSQYATPSF